VQQSSQFQVYNASAGSGKTFTLVTEYLKILLSTDSVFRFQQILAITFTNKAAAEMKERVLSSLQDFSEGNENVMAQIICDEIEVSYNVLKQRSKRVLTGILQNYSAFNITTIDSFTHRIIRSFAFDLGLSMNFDVEMDANLLLDEAVDVLISKIGEDANLTQVLIAYSLDKTDDDKSWDISRDLKDFAKILLNENHVNHLKLLENKSVKDYSNLNNHLKKEIKNATSEFAQIGNQGLAIIKGMELEHKDFYRSMLPNHFLNLADDLSKAKFFDQSKLRERIEENSFYSKSKSDDIKTAIEGILPQLLNLYVKSEKLYQNYILNNLVLKSLIPLAVLKHINISLSEIKEQNNIRLNAEFNQLISDKIKDEPAPFIYEKIGEKFRHYFIDEMQDTSELQWQNLIPLIENTLTSETLDGQRGSLMLVGDAKQAIYRWRGGNAAQFINLFQPEMNTFSVEKEVKNLEVNRRSYSQIIDFNNEFFTHVSAFLENERYKELYVTGNHQKKTEKIGGFVQLSFVDIDKGDDEKEFVYQKRVLEIIENLDENFKKSDVCVLVRTKKQGVEISNYLVENNIPIISSETLLLKNNEIVAFIINLLTSIHTSTNKKAIANALCFLSNKSDIHQFLANRIDLNNHEIFESLTQIGFEFNEKEFTSLPFYDGIEYIIRSFNLIKKPNVFVQSFLDFVLEYEQKRGSGLNDFLEHWERKKESISITISDGQDAVKIMTIHKSKGLEFPIVIFSYDLNIYREIKPKIWYNNLEVNEYFGFETSLIDYSKKVSYAGNYGEQIFNTRKEELQLDNLNLLYVALTRAEEQLYIVTKNQEKEKELGEAKTYSDLFVDFLKSNEGDQQWTDERKIYNFGDPKKKYMVDTNIDNESIIQQEKFISSSWKNQNISIVSNSSKLWDSKQESAIEYGNLIHEILSKIKIVSDVKSIVDQYLFEGLLNKENVNEIKEILNKVVAHPVLNKFFKHSEYVKNEQEIVSKEGVIQIPDRLWINKKNIVIIDYKTGVQDKKHHHQINKYAETLYEMGYKVEKKFLVYIEHNVHVVEVN